MTTSGEGNDGNQTPTPTPEFNIVKQDDGILVNDVKYVLESDLIAHKEANSKRIEDITSQHKEELSKYMGDGDSTRQLLLQTQAERDSLKEQAEANSKLKAELDQAKADLLTHQARADTNSELALNYRKQFMIGKYGLTPDKLEGKDMNQLNFFEEALGAVIATGSNGNYAAGGGQGGSPAPTDPMERAKMVIEQAEKARHSTMNT